MSTCVSPKEQRYLLPAPGLEVIRSKPEHFVNLALQMLVRISQKAESYNARSFGRSRSGLLLSITEARSQRASPPRKSSMGQHCSVCDCPNRWDGGANKRPMSIKYEPGFATIRQYDPGN